MRLISGTIGVNSVAAWVEAYDEEEEKVKHCSFVISDYQIVS